MLYDSCQEKMAHLFSGHVATYSSGEGAIGRFSFPHRTAVTSRTKPFCPTTVIVFLPIGFFTKEFCQYYSNPHNIL